MQLQKVPRSPPCSSGNVFFLVGHHLSKWKTSNGYNLDLRFLDNGFFHKNQKGGKRYFSKCLGASISCSATFRNDSFLPSNDQLSDARVIYSVAPAMGHNQESHPESHFRVPAIVNTLDEMKLTSKFRGKEVIELQNFKPASVDDIVSVHARAYVSGLEKVMDQASEKGLIFIDGSGPTYATASVDLPGVISCSWCWISLS